MGILDTFQHIRTAIAAHDLAAIAALLTDDLQMSGGGRTYGKDAYLDLLRMYFTAFPDFAYNFGDANDSGGQIEVVYQISGTHRGTLDLNLIGIPLQVPATGRRITMPPTRAVIQLEGDKVCAVKSSPTPGSSLEDLLAQLGTALPDELR